MTDNLSEIFAYREAYETTSLYDVIMAVCDVCDLDNDEIAALSDDLEFGPAARELVVVYLPLNEGSVMDGLMECEQ